MKSAITEMRNFLEDPNIKSSSWKKEKKINELEGRSMEIILSEELRKKIKVKSNRTSEICWITSSMPIHT